MKMKYYLCAADKYEKALAEVYDELSSGLLELESFRDDRIEARVSVGSDRKVLFTSIPYDEGWSVYVDGVKAEKKAVLDGTFLAVELTEGEHELLFSYRQKCMIPGMACFTAGVLLITACYLAKNVKKKG